MTGTDANRIHVLLSWLLDVPSASGTVPTNEQGQAAAEYLAHHVHQRAGLGISGADVERLWPEHGRTRTQWAPADIPPDAVDAVFAALDPDDEVYQRDEDERAEIREALAAAAPVLVAATHAEERAA